jgi:hypothetical protein
VITPRRPAMSAPVPPATSALGGADEEPDRP